MTSPNKTKGAHPSLAGRRIAISGATGLVGSALRQMLEEHGAQVLPLARRKAGGDASSNPGCGEIAWDPASGLLHKEQAEGLDALVHLAGESIAGARWSQAKKRRIHDSRGPATERLVQDLAELERPPGTFVCASASGYFGDRGDERLVEDSPPGDTFLAAVCKHWERAARGAEACCERVVITRLGVVLSRDGGALEQMLPLFKLGLGGRLGSGQQYFPWIALDDAVQALCFVLTQQELSGPVHLVAPQEVTNAEFTEALGDALHRPTVLPAPAFGLRLALGEMADALLLSSTRLVPQKLLEAEFPYATPELPEALVQIL